MLKDMFNTVLRSGDVPKFRETLETMFNKIVEDTAMVKRYQIENFSL